MHCDRPFCVQVFDKKGDILAYPKVVGSLPFTDTGITYFFSDTYALACGGSDGLGSGRVSLQSSLVPCILNTPRL